MYIIFILSMKCGSENVTSKHQINSKHGCSISMQKLCNIWLRIATLSADPFLLLLSVCANNT